MDILGGLRGMSFKGADGQGAGARRWARLAPHGTRRGALLMTTGALLAVALAGCNLSLSGGSSIGGASAQSLNATPWCDQPTISFQDNSQATQQTLTDWGSVKGQLGFTPYLPATLPSGSCLDLVGGAIHDPIFGGRLSVTWVLPTTGPISLSEAPKQGQAPTSPQCAQEQQAGATTTVCIGALGNTNVTIAAHLSTAALQTYFNQLKPTTDWSPSAPTATATAAPTAPTATTSGQ